MLDDVGSIEESIARQALAYLSRHVGDATTIGTPLLRAGRWELPVYLSYADREVGVLVYCRDGVLLPKESTSPEAMRRAVATT